MSNKTFILGIGEPKSGTSWAYSYLANDKNFANAGNKEWNIWPEHFNILDIPEYLNGQKNLRYTAEDRLGRGFPVARHQKNNIEASVNKLRYCMIKIDRFYENFFKLLLNDSNKTVTGDFSPEYKLLNVDHLAQIKKRLERSGFNVKVVYLIRDPIERAWSAYKHTKKTSEELKKMFPNLGKTKNINTDFGDTPSVVEFFARTKEFLQEDGSTYNGGWFMYKSYYHETIENIAKVFEPQNTFVESYETFFTKEKIKEFSDFCGVDYNEEMINDVINANPHNDPLPPGAKKRMYKLLTTNNKVGDKYKKCYGYCLQRFPEASKQWMKDTV